MKQKEEKSTFCGYLVDYSWFVISVGRYWF